MKTFNIILSERQAGQIRRQFREACRDGKIDKAGMIAQPVTQFGGIAVANLKPPVLVCAVVTNELFDKLDALLKAQKP